MTLGPRGISAAVGCLVLPLAVAGCRGARTSGTGSKLLDVPPAREWRAADGEPRIGQPGERWELGEVSDGGVVEIAVVGRAPVGDEPNGLIVDVTRNGRSWRTEAYRQRSGALHLLGVREPGKPWILLDPPLTLVRLPESAGDAIRWRGVLKAGQQRMAALGESRTEDPVALRMPDGSLREAWPLRTTIALADGTANVAAIQEVRWLVPGLGLVARDRIENNKEVRLSLRSRRSPSAPR